MFSLSLSNKINFPLDIEMKTVTSEQISSDFHEIANKVRYNKESYILTRHNKPYVGIVPLELLKILAIIIKDSTNNKHLSKLLKEHATFLTDADISLLYELEARPAQTPINLKKAAVSIKGKLKGF